MSGVRFADITPEVVVVTIDVADVLRTVSDAQLRAECERRRPAPPEGEPALTGAHIRAARGLLDWPVHRLAKASGVSESTVKRLEERSEVQPRPGTVEAVRRALARGGAGFRAVEGELCVVRIRAASAGAVPAPPEPCRL